MTPPTLARQVVVCLLSLSAASATLGGDIVAHRGASHDAPENTLSAFRLAWQQGADAIEGDFYLSGDGHIVCCHDKSTGRTADADLEVARATLEELKRLDVGAWKDARFAGERMPTLEEVLSVVPEDKYILIEIKSGPEIVPVLRQVLAASALDAWQTKVIAFDAEVVRQVKRQIPEIDAFWLTSYRQDKRTGRWTPSLESILQTLRHTGADALDTQARREVVDRAFVARLRKEGYGFHVWTINDPAAGRWAQSLGVDSITTDRPAFLQQHLPVEQAARLQTSP